MAQEDKITVIGASGRSYEFYVYPWGQEFKPVGSVYLVLKKNLGLRPTYEILYVGQTCNLSERFDCHHKKQCFDRNGKTHIGVRVTSTEQERLAIERDLIAKYQPICNSR
ncbi:GIY-YIG nuclease family protein [Desulfurivibrio sp. D14AmB]|uniref:GIY-YIG nuclease family protein n=1 Tax=Desulfurivibrio sp. D14AmB TaxID=3374370 RepID=UPI00376ED592